MGLAVTARDEAGEQALIAAALAEPAAFAAIYERHWPGVYRYLRALGCDEDMAVDVTATTFERAMVSLAKFRGDGSGLGAWLMRIARNARIDALRRTSRQTDLRAAEHLAAHGVAHESDAELRVLVAQLPEPAREAISLRYAAGLTAAEIGQVLGKRPDAIQKLISRGLATLREAYRDQ